MSMCIVLCRVGCRMGEGGGRREGGDLGGCESLFVCCIFALLVLYCISLYGDPEKAYIDMSLTCPRQVFGNTTVVTL